MKRKVLAVALLALLVPALSFGAASLGQVFPIRPTNTLGASAVDSVTAPVRVLGAKMVAFYLRSAAAEGDSLTTVAVQVSTDGVNYIDTGISGVGGFGAQRVGTGLGVLGKTGRFIFLCPGTSTVNNPPWITWTFARLAITTTAQVDSFAVDAWHWDDNGAPDRRFTPGIPNR